jgi:putative nucleotidyltransferase with HDIG domain
VKIEDTRQIVQALAAAVKGLRLYAFDHPATARQVQNLHNSLVQILQLRQSIRLGLLQGVLFVDKHLLTQSFPAAQELARLLATQALSSIEFRAGLGLADLQELLNLLHAGTCRGPAFVAALQQLGIERISVAASDEEDDASQPRKVYRKALRVVDRIFNDVRMGEIPSSEEAMQVVKSMARLTMTDPHALLALSLLKDYDNYTFTHSVNVAVLALAVGRACAVSEEQLRTLGLGGLLHDLGKLKIDVAIITKPGRLTDAERTEIRRHPHYGADIAARMEGVNTEVVDIVLGHHLRYDRTGYPADVSGRPFPSLVDMATVADTYDAITTLRCYQRPSTPRRAIAQLRESAGSALDPAQVESFAAALGPYPVGSLVRLDNNEIGLVIKVDPNEPSLADIKILFAANGTQLATPFTLQLNRAQARHITAEVDPYAKGIDVADFFD